MFTYQTVFYAYSELMSGSSDGCSDVCRLDFHTGKCKSTGAGCNELVQTELRT